MDGAAAVEVHPGGAAVRGQPRRADALPDVVRGELEPCHMMPSSAACSMRSGNPCACKSCTWHALQSQFHAPKHCSLAARFRRAFSWGAPRSRCRAKDISDMVASAPKSAHSRRNGRLPPLVSGARICVQQQPWRPAGQLLAGMSPYAVCCLPADDALHVISVKGEAPRRTSLPRSRSTSARLRCSCAWLRSATPVCGASLRSCFGRPLVLAGASTKTLCRPLQCV